MKTVDKGVDTKIHPSFSPLQWADRFCAEHDTLVSLAHLQAGPAAWAAFDGETDGYCGTTMEKLISMWNGMPMPVWAKFKRSSTCLSPHKNR